MAQTVVAAESSSKLPRTMRGVVLTASHEHEIRDDLPVPRPGAMEVVCKVDSVAICGTDLHI
jgi:D-arabinose 1-dehydrogenase-like Zn-dependent alcohol dehydrogenase